MLEESKVRRLGGTIDIPIAVRVLAATNRSPEKAVHDKILREDLFYRLNVFHLSLPPLRDRKQDIPAIATAMIRDLNKKHGCRVTHLSPEVLAWFDSNSWPGNVRELRNQVERAVIMASAGEAQMQHLSGVIRAPKPIAASAPQAGNDHMLHVPVGSHMDDVEQAYIRLTLRHTLNNKKRAAEMLGLCLRTLHNKLRTYEPGKVHAASGGNSIE